MSEPVDFKKLEQKLWGEKEADDASFGFIPPGLPPASVGLASIRMKRWTRRLVVASFALVMISAFLWVTKTHHVLRVSTQDGYVKSVELLRNDR